MITMGKVRGLHSTLIDSCCSAKASKEHDIVTVRCSMASFPKYTIVFGICNRTEWSKFPASQVCERCG